MSAGRDRHSTPCVSGSNGDCAYLNDGTRVVLRREGGKIVSLAVERQAVMAAMGAPTDPPRLLRTGVGPRSARSLDFDALVAVDEALASLSFDDFVRIWRESGHAESDYMRRAAWPWFEDYRMSFVRRFDAGNGKRFNRALLAEAVRRVERQVVR